MMSVEQGTSSCATTRMANDAMCRTTEAIKEYPGLSMLIVFGVGVGVGALIGESIPMPSAMKSETTFERIGRQLCSALNIQL